MANRTSDLTTIGEFNYEAAYHEATFLALMAKSTLKLGTTSTSAPEYQSVKWSEHKLV